MNWIDSIKEENLNENETRKFLENLIEKPLEIEE